ncbi:MAG: hypothetical protein WC370_07765 [Dehalococcoidales bacterium]
MKLKAILLAAMAVILVSGYIGAAYACFNLPFYGIYSWGQAELKIRDQDESWRDGVFATWTASNMAPGDEYAFAGSFVGLKAQSARMPYTGTMSISCSYSPWKPGQPDKMAKYMVITRCVYIYSYMNEQRQIDLLTGKTTRVSGPGYGIGPANQDWQIQDIDRDGRITFYDLKARPLKNIPASANNEARYEMSVSFHETAGDEFQHGIFNLTMYYTLTSW